MGELMPDLDGVEIQDERPWVWDQSVVGQGKAAAEQEEEGGSAHLKSERKRRWVERTQMPIPPAPSATKHLWGRAVPGPIAAVTQGLPWG